MNKETEKEIFKKIADIIELSRNDYYPKLESRNVNDVKALGVALGKCLGMDLNIMSVAYFALKEIEPEKAESLRTFYENEFQCSISNGYRHVPKVMGMTCDVYTTDYSGIDCTLGGITSKKKRVLLVGEGVPEIFEPGSEEEILVLEKRVISGKEYLSAKPWTEKENNQWTMFGGNFIYSSDSRFPSKYPIPVHDRIESREN